jgi:hypothetical protein
MLGNILKQNEQQSIYQKYSTLNIKGFVSFWSRIFHTWESSSISSCTGTYYFVKFQESNHKFNINLFGLINSCLEISSDSIR